MGTTFTEELWDNLEEVLLALNHQERLFYSIGKHIDEAVDNTTLVQAAITSNLYETHTLCSVVHSMHEELEALRTQSPQLPNLSQVLEGVPGLTWVQEARKSMGPVNRYFRAKKCASQLRSVKEGIRCLKRKRQTLSQEEEGESTLFEGAEARRKWELVRPSSFDLNVYDTPTQEKTQHLHECAKRRKVMLREEQALWDAEEAAPPTPSPTPSPLASKTAEEVLQHKRHKLEAACTRQCTLFGVLCQWEDALEKVKQLNSFAKLEARDAYNTYYHLRERVEELATTLPKGGEWDLHRLRLLEIAALKYVPPPPLVEAPPPTEQRQ